MQNDHQVVQNKRPAMQNEEEVMQNNHQAVQNKRPAIQNEEEVNIFIE